MRGWFFLVSLFLTGNCFCQVDTNYLKKLYDRCLDFSEIKQDSILYYAKFIEQESKILNFNKGEVLSLRLKGLYEEFRSDYQVAIFFYLKSLEAARKLKVDEYEMSALSDLAIAYYTIKQPYKAKDFYLMAAAIAARSNNLYTTISTYNNLAVIYTELKQYDSSLLFLQESLRLGKPHENEIDLSSTYNSMGNVYFKQKDFDKAKDYFFINYHRHKSGSDPDALWVANINLADVYTEQHRFDSGMYHASAAMQLAEQLGSRSKQADSYSLLAKLYERKGNYKMAYDNLKNWYTLDTAMVNSDTQRSIAELQEKFNARERESENNLLIAQVAQQRLRARTITILAIGLGVTGILIAIAFVIKKNANTRLQATNRLVILQNEKLAELNREKNSLISIVSHDLGTPFATIHMWGQIMESSNNHLSEEQKTALNRIVRAGQQGQQMIRRILDVEKSDIATHQLQLEQFDCVSFIKKVGDDFRSFAFNKEINMNVRTPDEQVYILSDKLLLARICENLLSNAVKYTPRGKEISLELSHDNGTVQIEVSDEGVGIPNHEMPFLFAKYSKISSKPTDGESSTGLGLSIVKRLVDELNGKINCDSEPGRGTRFRVTLKK